jgi:DDE superfamily endonuclease
MMVDVHRPWRKVKVTERRAAEDYARCMRELVNVHYPDAKYIRVVQDNLSTHSAGSLYDTFPPAEARRILRRLEFHYTPSTPAGSTWSRSKLECCAASALTGASTVKISSNARSRLGNVSATPQAPASNGCSQPKKLAPKWPKPTRSPPAFQGPSPKSHNHCAAVLGRLFDHVDDLAILRLNQHDLVVLHEE